MKWEMFEEDSDDDDDDDDGDEDDHNKDEENQVGNAREHRSAAPRGREEEFKRRVDALFAKKKQEQELALVERQQRERQKTIKMNRERMRRERDQEKKRKVEERKKKAAEIRAQRERAEPAPASATAPHMAKEASLVVTGEAAVVIRSVVTVSSNLETNGDAAQVTKNAAAKEPELSDEKLQDLVAEISDIFTRLDTNQNGEISISELRTALSLLSSGLSEVVSRQIVSGVEDSGSQSLSFESFVAWCRLEQVEEGMVQKSAKLTRPRLHTPFTALLPTRAG